MFKSCGCGCGRQAKYLVKGFEDGKPYEAYCCESAKDYLTEWAYEEKTECEVIYIGILR